MRIAVVEVGPARCGLLVGDVEAGSVTPVVTHEVPTGLDEGEWQAVLATVGELICAAAEQAAERFVAVVTARTAAAAFGDCVQALFNVKVRVLGDAAAAAHALVGAALSVGPARLAVHLGRDATGVATASGTWELPFLLAGLRRRFGRRGGALAGRELAAAASMVRRAAAPVVRDLGAKARGALVVAGARAGGLSAGTVATDELRDRARRSPEAAEALTAIALAELADAAGADTIAVDPAATRSGALLLERHREDAPRRMAHVFVT